MTPSEKISYLIEVIEFAEKQGFEASDFLSCWIHADLSEWPEFNDNGRVSK